MIKSVKGIRWVVISFSICLAFMLYQTDYMNLGSIIALATTGITFLLLLVQVLPSGRLGKFPLSLLLFLFFSVITTIATSVTSELLKLVIQVLFCMAMFSIRLSNKENSYLKWAFIASMTFYSLLIIKVCSSDPSRYFHGDIQLFNTEFDPNYIALPIVCSMVFLLGNIIDKQSRIVSAVLFSIMVVSLMYTASRGAFLGLICGTITLTILSLFKKEKGSRFIQIFFLAILFFLLIYYLFPYFEEASGRLTDFNGENIDNGRIGIWSLSIEKWLERPIFGFGVGSNIRVLGFANHNTFVELLFCTGLVGLTLFLLILYAFYKKAKRCSIVHLAVFISLAVQCVFLDCLSNRCFWLLLTWMAMLPDNVKKDFHPINPSDR